MKNDRKNFESNPSVQWCNEQRKNDHIPLKTTRTNAICAKISLWPTTKTDSSIFSRELVCGVRLALVLRAVEKKKKSSKKQVRCEFGFSSHKQRRKDLTFNTVLSHPPEACGSFTHKATKTRMSKQSWKNDCPNGHGVDHFCFCSFYS